MLRRVVILLVVMVAVAVISWLVLCQRSNPSCEREIISEPPGASVFVNDRFVGTTPLSIGLRHNTPGAIRIERHGYKRWSGIIEGSSTEQLRVELEPRTGCVIEVSCSPNGARAYLDGEPVGTTPLRLEDVKPGAHRVSVRMDNFETEATQFELQSGESKQLVFVLKSRVEQYYLSEIKNRPDKLTNYAELAHHYLVMGMIPRAVDTLTEGMILTARGHPNEDEGRNFWREVHNAYAAEFDYGGEEAVAEFRERLVGAFGTVITYHPECQHLYEMLLRFCRKDLRTLRRTVEILEGAVKRAPGGVTAHSSLAMAYLWAGDTVSAQREANRALTLYSHDGHANYVLGMVALRRGDRRTALSHLAIASRYCTDPELKREIMRAIRWPIRR